MYIMARLFVAMAMLLFHIVYFFRRYLTTLRKSLKELINYCKQGIMRPILWNR